MGRFLALVAALILGGLIAWAQGLPPHPQGVDTAAAAFSAQRALADIGVIAQAPHPVGSARNQQVRDYLLSRMTVLGLQPQVRADTVFAAAPLHGPANLHGGRVENLVGVLPGRDPTAPALTLMAHYDSVAGSPGASDDAAGVAAILEAVRAIRARGVPARDVLVVITDGEEAGLLGSKAFFQHDPLRGRVGFLINLEARGSSGRALMFETGAANGGAIDLLRRTARRPVSSSLAVFVYRLMSNDTDFTNARAAGVAGFNYAFMGRQFDYHSPTATPASMDPGTLQDLGDQLLSTAGDAAFAPALPARSPDVVYSQVFGDMVLAYPPAFGWLILAACAVLIAVGLWRARRLAPVPWSDLARGAGAAAFAVFGAGAVLVAARRATGAGFGFLEQRVLLAQAYRWEAALVLLGLGFLLLSAATLARGRRSMGLVPLAAGLAGSAFGGFDPLGLALGAIAAVIALLTFARPVARPGGWAGVMLAALALAVLVQAIAPLAAQVFAWPLLLAAAGAAATALASRVAKPWLVLLGLLAAVGLGWVGGVAHLVYLGLDLPLLLVLPIWMAAPLVWPLAQPEEGAPPARLLGPALMIGGLALLALVRFDPPWDARTPQASYVAYLMDQDSGRAWLISDPLGRSAWSDTLLRSGGGQLRRLSHWAFPRALDAAQAPVSPQPAPAITLEHLGSGDLRLRAVPPPGARVMALWLRTDTIAALTEVSGSPTAVALKPGAWTRLHWEGDQQGPVLVIRPAGPGTLDVRYGASTERWPVGAPPLPPRPANQMAFGDSDAISVTGTRRFAW
jgi:hypothetical protein